MEQKLREDFMEEAYSTFLTTLSNKTRLKIMQALEEGPKNVSQLTDDLDMHQTSVSHALRRLRDCGFVFVDQKGRERYYSLNEETIKPLVELMEKHVEEYCSKRCV